MIYFKTFIMQCMTYNELFKSDISVNECIFLCAVIQEEESHTCRLNSDSL